MRVPIGIEDFKIIRENGYYYVDKSVFIDDVVKNNVNRAVLYTRPRGFGKSLNLSMLDAYLNMDYAGNTWFDDLEISKIRPDDREKNAHPVIFLDMKRLDGCFVDFVYTLRSRMTELYVDMLDLDDGRGVLNHPDSLFPDIYEQDGLNRLRRSLYDLARKVFDRTGRKVVILIDGYDDAVNNASSGYFTTDDDRKMILDFTESFLGNVLSRYDYAKTVVITGIMDIGKECASSGFDSLVVDSVLTRGSDDRFGFTPDEVRVICSDFEHPEKYDEAKEWYGGYRFGNTELYNPWSILKYASSGFRPGIYWADTCDNSLFNRLIDNLGGALFKDLMKLASGKEVRETIAGDVVYADIEGKIEDDDLLPSMVMRGYLRASHLKEQDYMLSIPNKEVKNILGDMFARKLGLGREFRNLQYAIDSMDNDHV